MAPLTLMKRVQKLQNFAAKICVGGARRRDHVTPFITQMNWLKIERNIFFFAVAVAVYKMQNNTYPEWFLLLRTITDVA